MYKPQDSSADVDRFYVTRTGGWGLDWSALGLMAEYGRVI